MVESGQESTVRLPDGALCHAAVALASSREHV